MSITTDGEVDGTLTTGPFNPEVGGYRDYIGPGAVFGSEFEPERMPTPFDPSGSYQDDDVIMAQLQRAYNLSPEDAYAAWNSLMANTAMAREFGGAAPYTPPITPAPTPAAGGDDIFDVLKGLPGAAVDAAKSAADTLLNQIKEILPFYDQAQIVLNPRTGTGNIVFGTPPAGQPVIHAGNLPGSNTNVGITTGISILDQAINSVLGRQGGLESGSIRDEVIKIISEQTGASPAATAGILGEDLDTILSTANVKAAEAATRLGVDLTGEKKDVVRDGGTGVVRDDTGATLGGGKIITGAADSPIVTGAADSPIVTGAADAVDIVTGSLTPADLGEDTTVKTTQPDTVKAGTPGTPVTPVTPAPSQGMRMEATEKAGLADINSTFDLDATFMENLMRALSGKDDAKSEAPYYSGGKVAPYAGVDEIIRLLRG
jgi:hypothetical protein